MLRLIIFLLVAIALSLLATWFADNPGQVALEWLGLRIETVSPKPEPSGAHE